MLIYMADIFLPNINNLKYLVQYFKLGDTKTDNV